MPEAAIGSNVMAGCVAWHRGGLSVSPRHPSRESLMIRMVSTLALFALALTVPGPLQAQSVAMPASPDQDVSVTTCAGFYLALTSANPGPNASQKRRAQAKAAQDELFKVLLWVHGYTTGRAGPDAKPQPLSSEWMRATSEKLRVICADDTRATLHMAEAVKQL